MIYLKIFLSFVLTILLVFVIENSYSYFTFGGLGGSLTSTMISVLAFIIAIAFIIFFYIKVWKLK